MITLTQILIETRTRRRQADAAKYYHTSHDLYAIEKLLEKYIEQERHRRAMVPIAGEIGEIEE